jgi:hypothetical protein
MDPRLGFPELLAIGFAELNKQGIFAAQNWWCDTTGGHDLMETLVPKEASYAFYHSQDDDYLRERENNNMPPQVMLAWRGDAERICEILRSVGLGVDWDGDSDERIRVFKKPGKAEDMLNNALNPPNELTQSEGGRVRRVERISGDNSPGVVYRSTSVKQEPAG